jgi:NitT/TauT family transport system substrate-binding protein
MLSRNFLVAVALGSLALAFPRGASAETIRVGYTPSASFDAAFIAKDQGFFQKHGLDVELQVIALNSNIPSAMVAGSIDIGGTTTTVLLQAIDSGIDLAVLSGTNLTFAASTNSAIVARNGSGIEKPADFVGKKLGVPGIGAIVDVMARQWLKQRGVDYTQVGYVELPFPQQPDALKNGLVDAVVTVEPTYSRILRAGLGKDVGRAYSVLPLGTQTILYSATRSWASAHARAMRDFDDANAEGAAYAEAHPDDARAAIAKYMKLPPEAAQDIELPHPSARVTKADIDSIADIMTQQHMLHGAIDATKLLPR